MPSFTGPLYRLYAWRLVREIRRRPVPGHVGIILDGKRGMTLLIAVAYGGREEIADAVPFLGDSVPSSR